MSKSVGMRSVFYRLPLFAVCFAIATVIVSTPARGQEVTAAINGVVSDPSGGAVVGARVTAKDLDRGTVFPTTTNSGGEYNLPRIPVGRYEVRVESPGFQAAVQSPVELQLNQAAKIDFRLQVGNVNQTIEVTTAAPVLQTETTQLGTVIDARTNAALPLATRNYVQLTLLAPGAVTTNPSSFTGPEASFNGGRPLINGNREQADNFILDGMDNNQISENAVGYTPSVDAIQEFNMITQNASAEFGRFMGGIINVSIKGGTNQFHGDAFEFFRNDKLNANNWANNWNDLPRPLLRWNEFGGAVGGPIKRDRLFFFADYQGSRYDQPATSSAYTVLTAEERAGNFAQLCAAGFTSAGICLGTPSSTNIQLHYPLSTKPIPFNNLATAGLLSPQAVAIMSSPAYPGPVNENLVNNAINTQHSYTNQDQGDIKVDWAVSDNDHVFGRYSQAHIANPTTNSIPLLYNSTNTYPSYNGVIDYTKTFSPTFVNDARFGVNYIPVITGALSGSGISAQSVGVPGVPTTILPGFVFTGGNLASDSVNGAGVAFGNPEVFEEFSDTVIQPEDTAILTRGTHTIRIGFQAFRERIDTFYSGNAGIAGQFGFNGQYTGAAEADFAAGLPYNVEGGIAGGTWGQRATIYAAFAQDDWRATPNLTLNVGLRWELHTPWIEVHNRQANFNEITGAEEFPGQDGFNRALYDQYNGITNFQPRVGLAWTPGGRNTVIRAAFTTSNFLEGTGTNLRLTLNPPFATEHNVNYSGTQTPSTLAQGYTVFGAGTNPATEFVGTSIRVWGPNIRPAVSNQWNFTIQHQFGNSTTLQVGYVGQRADHLMVPIWMSQRYLEPDGTVVPGYLGANPTLLNEIGNAKLTDTVGYQNYNALQASLQKRLSNGLEFQANYTWSKCLTDSIGYYGGYGQATGDYYYWQDTYNARQFYGPCYYDVEHAFNGFVTYDIPFGRGRAFGKNMNKVVNALIGDWQINAIVSWRGGFPITINDSFVDNTGTDNPWQLANCNAPGHVFGERDSALGGYQWFDTSVYSEESPGHFGTCGIGTIRGPGLHTADLSLIKLFAITEHQNLEFRAEAINFTNTPILNQNGFSSDAVLSSTFGLVQNSQGERNIQFGLKYNF